MNKNQKDFNKVNLRIFKTEEAISDAFHGRTGRNLRRIRSQRMIILTTWI